MSRRILKLHLGSGKCARVNNVSQEHPGESEATSPYLLGICHFIDERAEARSRTERLELGLRPESKCPTTWSSALLCAPLWTKKTTGKGHGGQMGPPRPSPPHTHRAGQFAVVPQPARGAEAGTIGGAAGRSIGTGAALVAVQAPRPTGTRQGAVEALPP